MEIDTKNLTSDFGPVATATSRSKKEAIASEASAQQTIPHTSPPDEKRKKVEELLKEFATSDQVTMQYDSEIDRVIVTVTDGETKEVITQIPSSDLISYVKSFNKIAGLVVNRRA